jgi:hypothetical protein
LNKKRYIISVNFQPKLQQVLRKMFSHKKLKERILLTFSAKNCHQKREIRILGDNLTTSTSINPIEVITISDDEDPPQQASATLLSDISSTWGEEEPPHQPEEALLSDVSSIKADGLSDFSLTSTDEEPTQQPDVSSTSILKQHPCLEHIMFIPEALLLNEGVEVGKKGFVWSDSGQKWIFEQCPVWEEDIRHMQKDANSRRAKEFLENLRKEDPDVFSD